jgi:peptidyl-prolyl cis-trans isomerase SurA
MKKHFVVLVCLTVLGACTSSTPAPPPAPSADVWAVVNGQEIRRDEVEKAYRRAVDQAATPSDEEAMSAKLSLIDDLVTQDLLLAKAKAAGVTVTDAEIDTAFTERKQNMTEEAFQKEIAQRGLTAAEMKDGLRRELTVQKLMEQAVDATIKVTDQDVTNYYNAHREQFHLTEPTYHIAQIVVTPTPGQVTNRQHDDAATPEAATRKMQMLAERLKAGTPFSQLALDYSEDPQSAPQGGDLGFVPASRLQQVAAPLRDAVLKAQPGTVTQINAGGVYTIVLLVEKEAAGQRELSTPGVKENITGALRDRKGQLLRAAYLANLRNDAKIVNYLAKQLAPLPPAPPGLAPAAPKK